MKHLALQKMMLYGLMNNREFRFGSALSFSFEIKHAHSNSLARVGTINTPHGQIQTPAFIPVGTKATVKSVLPESMKDLGSQALLSNAYHPVSYTHLTLPTTSRV